MYNTLVDITKSLSPFSREPFKCMGRVPIYILRFAIEGMRCVRPNGSEHIIGLYRIVVAVLVQIYK